MIQGSEKWVDVTSYLEGIRNGATDYGLAVIADVDTLASDGWAVFFNGSSSTALRPRLVVISDLTPITPPGVLGDYNNNGVVDAADYVLWRKGGPLQNESDTPGTVNGADYTYWQSRFGATSGSGSSLGGASVPEPTTWFLGFAASVVFTSLRTRKS
jgi:hypothetical protein